MINLYQYKKEEFFLKRKIPFLWVVVFLIVVSSVIILIVRHESSQIPTDVAVVKITPRVPEPEPPPKPEWKFKPWPVSMEKMKTKGCVADGMLSGYGGNTGSMTKLINRSECYYLHRALETWNAVPDFEEAENIMERVTKEPIMYGMFIAEALKDNADYDYPDKERKFDFSRMCRDGTDGRWGFHTCVPDMGKPEYRRYVLYITKQAMDIGIQSFLFGQVFLQDDPDPARTQMPGIVKEMRQYAKEKGIQIVIGAQTNSITDEKYLKLFDFIEGGVGINSAGNIEDGPCWSKKNSCWALLWHKDFSSKARNVFLHLDWSGLRYDDMSIFAGMNHETRVKTLKNLHQYFISQNMGFMMPFLATINKTIGGCHGPMKRFYSPDDKYSCNDENEINAILRGS